MQVDFDYGYSTSGDNSININLRSPYSMSTELNVAPTGRGSAVINWDTNSDYRNIRFDFGLKNVETSSLVDRAVHFKTAVSRRTVGFAVGYKWTPARLTSHGELHWDADSQPDFVYDFDLRQTLVQRRPAYDGSIRVSSYLFNTNSRFSHRMVSDGHFVSEVNLDLAERLTIRSDLNLASTPAITHQITVQHPRLSRVRNVFLQHFNFIIFGCHTKVIEPHSYI